MFYESSLEISKKYRNAHICPRWTAGYVARQHEAAERNAELSDSQNRAPSALNAF